MYYKSTVSKGEKGKLLMDQFSDSFSMSGGTHEPCDSQQAPLHKDPLVLSILGVTAITNSAYAIIAPFLPFEFKKKGIDQTWIGYIFAIYSIAVILCSPVVGSMIAVLGRRNLIIAGLLLMGCSFLAFGLMSEIENKQVFITLVLLNRFL